MSTKHRTAICILAAVSVVTLAGCADRPTEDAIAEAPVAVAAPVAEPTINTAVVPLEGWTVETEPQVVVGDDLFELINGGAELYHQIGFVQALAADYADGDGRSIVLEVFEMADEQAAAAIFAEKAGGTGEPAQIGDEAAVESYYLNARTGQYLITITGFESDDVTSEAVLQLARTVAAELGGAS